MVFLDAAGEAKLKLGTAGDGAPLVELSKGNSRVRLESDATSGELAINIEGSSTRCQVTRSGVFAFEGKDKLRVAVQVSDEMNAECYFRGRGGRSVGMYSNAIKSSLAFGDQVAGLEVAEGKQVFWLGSPPVGPEKVKKADGISLAHASGVGSYISAREGDGSKRVHIQSTPRDGTGMQIGDEGVDPCLRMGISDGVAKLPYLEVVDQLGMRILRIPAESK